MKRLTTTLAAAFVVAAAMAAKRVDYLFEIDEDTIPRDAVRTVVWLVQPTATSGFSISKHQTYDFRADEVWARSDWPNYVEFQNADGRGVAGYFIASHTNALESIGGIQYTVDTFAADKFAPAEFDRWMKRNGHIPRPVFYAPKATKVMVK